MTRTGGQILVDQLRIHGVDTIFTVPGESFLAALDALHETPEIRLVVCRQEGGAANMAEAYGKLTGRPGVCFVTRGPGATNASVGVHTAFQDSTPLLLLVGDVARGHREREAFQEVDFRTMFASLSKWAAQVDDAERLPELVSRAFHTACAGRPGPAVLALQEDMLSESAEAADAEPYKVVRAHPGAEDMARLRELLGSAQRPLMIVGGGGWSGEASRDILAFAVADRIPTSASFRCQDYVDNHSEIYVGDVGLGVNPALAQRIKDADLLLVVGARLGEATTSGYELVEAPRPRQTLVHVHADPEELGRVYQGELLINSGLPQFAAAARALEQVESYEWHGWCRAARADYLASLRHEPWLGEGVDMGEVLARLRESLPEDAIVTNGAGDRKSTRLNSSHSAKSRMPSSA